MSKKYSFMPSYYKEPESISGYLNPSQLDEGAYKIRILSEPIVGWEEWANKKPFRYRFDDKPDEPKDASREPYLFTAMIVWNYTAKAIQILHIKQASLRKGLIKLADDPEWGAPYFYDITINKEGEGKTTEYSLNPVPPKPTASHIEEAYRAKPIWLDALFESVDPFAPSDRGEITPGIFSADGGATGPTASLLPPSLDVLMDRLPGGSTRESVQEFVKICADRAKVAEDVYIAKVLASESDTEKFAEFFERWSERRKAKSA